MVMVLNVMVLKVMVVVMVAGLESGLRVDCALSMLSSSKLGW